MERITTSTEMRIQHLRRTRTVTKKGRKTQVHCTSTELTWRRAPGKVRERDWECVWRSHTLHSSFPFIAPGQVRHWKQWKHVGVECKTRGRDYQWDYSCFVAQEKTVSPSQQEVCSCLVLQFDLNLNFLSEPNEEISSSWRLTLTLSYFICLIYCMSL